MAKTARELDREIADHQERDRLARRVQKLLDKWQPIVGVNIASFNIKKMRAFASANVRDGRLWINQALATLSPADLEYVVVHELAHLRLRESKGSGHNARFYALMDQFLPNWRRRHSRLRSGNVTARSLPGV